MGPRRRVRGRRAASAAVEHGGASGGIDIVVHAGMHGRGVGVPGRSEALLPERGARKVDR